MLKKIYLINCKTATLYTRLQISSILIFSIPIACIRYLFKDIHLKLSNIIILTSILCFNIVAQQKNAENIDQLIFFYNSNSQQTNSEEIFNFKQFADKMKLDFVEIDVKNGIPEQVVYTPCLVFQNKEGRSFYYGRYTNLDRLRNFIRASGMVHQKEVENVKHNLLVWETEKAVVTAPLKLTELDGTIPKNFDPVEFANLSKIAVYKGMSKFQFTKTFNQNRTTRSFYFNLYPYINEEENLTISAEIFSQYNCVKPVWQKFDEGLVQGKWKNRTSLFTKAGELIENEILNIIEFSKTGDAFEPIPSRIPTVDWKELGLAITENKDLSKNLSIKDIELSKKWKVKDVAKSGLENDPIIVFSFLPPLDNYAGEAKKLSGGLTLASTKSLENATGSFSVEIEDVTMGAEDFDYEVQNKMLKMGIFPNATFKFDSLKPIGTGENSTAYETTGVFSLLGMDYQLNVEVDIVPIKVEDGKINLRVKSSFELPLFDVFGVAGPDGPSPSKDVLQFFMKFDLE